MLCTGRFILVESVYYSIIVGESNIRPITIFTAVIVDLEKYSKGKKKSMRIESQPRLCHFLAFMIPESTHYRKYITLKIELKSHSFSLTLIGNSVIIFFLVIETYFCLNSKCMTNTSNRNNNRAHQQIRHIFECQQKMAL